MTATPNSHQPSVRELALREWTWRVGPDAAAHRIAISRWTLRIWILGVVGFVLVLAGAKVGSAPVWITGIAVYVVGLLSTVCAWMDVVRYRRATSSALGIRIRFRSNPPPPNRGSNYLAWCEKYGVQPYPFRPPSAKG